MAAAKVQTVLGDVEPSSLGMTLTHEHLSMDYSCIYVEPSKEEDRAMVNCPFTLPNLHWIHRHPFSHKNNLILNDAESRSAVTEELKRFKAVGGGTIVENTTTGLHRDVAFLKQLAQQVGINIVAGAGFYIAKAQSESVKNKSVEQLSDILRREMTVSADANGDVKCGFIGEIASVHPLEAFERRVLKASGAVQSELGCGVMIHPHRVKNAPYDAIRVYLEAGGRAGKVVMAHMDRTLLDVESLLDFASFGCYLEFDMFGIECSHYQLNESTDMPSDAQRIQLIKGLVEHGLQDNIVLSHDIYAKHRMMQFGGHGYSHLITNIIPKMLNRGISPDVIQQFFVHNPAKWLSY